MSLRRLFMLLIFTTASTTSIASDLTVTLSNKSAGIDITPLPPSSQIHTEIGYLRHENSRHLYHADLHAQGQTVIANLPATTGLGFRTMVFDEKNVDGISAGFGGFINLNIPEVPGLSVAGSLHIAPSILSFSDLSGYQWIDLKSRYRVIQNADLLVGYRYVHSGLEEMDNRTIESSFYVGLRYLF
ncbi:MAG: YfaZ family protein [Pseudomonadales bacterium]|nr:YfaZ family outer membrane protein [Oleiphilus messinensis]MCG8613707.1 YfaZ family protein [Pseudomonadales bacterium]